MKLKRIVSIALSALMVAGGAAMLAGCNNGNDWGGDAKYKYAITVWVGENTKALTENLIKEFNETNDKSIYFKATVREQSESNAAGDVIGKPESAPEIFCFAQDQMARLVNKGLLARPGSSVENAVKATHSVTSVAAATVGSAVYAYPLSEDNGYFLYYNKDVISETQAQTVEGIIAACESAEKNFSFLLTGTNSGWYAASFFTATGAKSEWTTDDNGKFTAKNDTYNSAEGLIALKGIQKVVKAENCYNASDKASAFESGVNSAAVVSGIWDYETAKDKLGDKLGIAPLPSFTVDDVPYQLKSSLGCKLLGVTPQKDATKATALSILAQYLTDEQSQLKRFEERGWRPTVKTLQANETITSDALTALQESTTKDGNVVAQGQFPFEWWAYADELGAAAQGAAGEGALQNALNNYESHINGLIK